MNARLLAVMIVAIGCSDQTPPITNPCPPDTPVASPTPPPLRSDFTGVFDVLTQSMYVFSGDPGQPQQCGASGNALLTDMWRYSVRCQYWIQVPMAMSPPPRTGAASVHEGFPANRNRMIMFGGRGADGQLLNDVWAYDFLAQAWTQLTTMGTPPSPRENATIGFNATYDQIFLFGGNTSADASQPQLVNDVWMLDIDNDKNQWTLMPISGGGLQQPAPRQRHVAIFNPPQQAFYVGFGETQSGTYLKDIWVYTYDLTMMPPKGGWILASPGTTGPSARIDAGMDLDSAGSRILLFGGVDQDQGPRNDLWEFSLGATRTWKLDQAGDQLKNTGGSACMRPSDFVTPDLGMPERRGGMLFAFGYPGFPYVLGGQGDCGDLRDVWTYLQANGWLQLEHSTDGFSCARRMAPGCTSYCQ
jgi:hypothetical protein